LHFLRSPGVRVGGNMTGLGPAWKVVEGGLCSAYLWMWCVNAVQSG
jgi:hypothetical protein